MCSYIQLYIKEKLENPKLIINNPNFFGGTNKNVEVDTLGLQENIYIVTNFLVTINIVP